MVSSSLVFANVYNAKNSTRLLFCIRIPHINKGLVSRDIIPVMHA